MTRQSRIPRGTFVLNALRCCGCMTIIGLVFQMTLRYQAYLLTPSGLNYYIRLPRPSILPSLLTPNPWWVYLNNRCRHHNVVFRSLSVRILNQTMSVYQMANCLSTNAMDQTPS